MKASMAQSLDEQWLLSMIGERDGEWTDSHCKKLASAAHRRPVKNLILPTHFMVVFEWLSKARASSLCGYVAKLQPQSQLTNNLTRNGYNSYFSRDYD